MKRIRRILVPGLLGLGGCYLAGCAGFGLGSEEYSCSGLPSGVQCHSAREVYLAHGQKAQLERSQNTCARQALSEAKAQALVDFQETLQEETLLEKDADWNEDWRQRYPPPDFVFTEQASYTDEYGKTHAAKFLLRKLPGSSSFLSVAAIKDNGSSGAIGRYAPVPHQDKHSGSKSERAQNTNTNKVIN